MIDDDWSLKGHSKIRCEESHDGTDFDDCFECIDVEDIKTLRLKLIEDIQNLPNDGGYPCMHPSRKLLVSRIINKRFGVDI